VPSGLDSLAALYATPKERKPRRVQDDLGVLAPFDELVVPEVEPEVSPENLLPKSQGAFMSALNYIGRFGQVGKNLAMLDFEGAARQGADILGDTVDSVLPGDWIPEASRAQDYKTGSDVMGISKEWQEEHPLLNIAASLPLDLLLDPLTFTGLGVAGQIGKTAAKGAQAANAGRKALSFGVPFTKRAVEIPGSAQALESTGKALSAGFKKIPGHEEFAAGAGKLWHGVKRATGNLTPDREVADLVAKAGAKGSTTAQAATGAAVETFKDIPLDIQRRAIETIRGVSSEVTQGTYTDLGINAPSKFLAKPEQMAVYEQRLAALPWDDATKAAVRDVINKADDFTRTQFTQAVDDKVFSLPGVDGLSSSRATKELEQAPADYFTGRYLDPAEEAAAVPGVTSGKPIGSTPNVVKGKEITSSADLATYLNDTGKTLEADIPKILGQYGESMGRAVKQAALGERLAPDTFKALSDPGSRRALKGVVDTLRQAGKHDNADVLDVAINGLPAREGIFTMLATANRFFKQGATGGAFVPKPAFTLRNLISSPLQTLANPEARAAAWQMAKNIPRDFIESFQDGFRTLGIPKMGESRFAPIQAAIKASGGSREKMLAAITDPEMRLAVEHGVLDSGFISTEQMQAAVAKAGNIKDWRNWKDWPSDVVKGSEQRMRFGLFRKLMAEGNDASNAARITTDSLYDYAYASSLNRSLRDLIPFGQFMFKAIPQQAKFLAEQPAVAVGLESLVGERNNKDQVFPYQEGRVNIPLGKDNEGDPVFASGLGLPVEALNALPNPSANPLEFGRQIGRNVVGASQPLLKSALSIAFGVDPYFGNSYGSYSRLPGNIEGGKLGSAYNMAAGTGLATPITEPLRLIGKVADDRQTPGQKALDLLTGMNVSSVNQDKALQQRLTEYLRRNPDVSIMEILHAKSNDPKTVQLIKELNAAKARIKERRKAKDP